MRLNRVIVLAFLLVLVAAVSLTVVVLEEPHPRKIKIGGVVLTVEIAETAEAQLKGLSGRDSMQLDHGMLFVFDHEDTWGFWMHEMRFPLDIIWFNSNRQAVYIEQNLQPCGPAVCLAYVPKKGTMYVLEVNAGFVSTHNLSLGESFSWADTIFPP